MQKYLYGIISATSKKEANLIFRKLLKDHLIAGGLITIGDAKFWWKGKIDEEPYWNLNIHTISKNKSKIIKIVEELSKDETPVVVFFKSDLNKKSQKWIDEFAK